MRRVGQLLAVLALAAGVLLLAEPAAAEPLATTTTVTAVAGPELVTVTVSTSSASGYAKGPVDVYIDGSLHTAVNRLWTGSPFTITYAPGRSGPVTVTAEFRGSVDAAPSSGSATVEFAAPAPIPATGTVTVGSASAVLSEVIPARPSSIDELGVLSMRSVFESTTPAVDVPGTGSTSLTVRWTLAVTGVVDPDGAVRVATPVLEAKVLAVDVDGTTTTLGHSCTWTSTSNVATTGFPLIGQASSSGITLAGGGPTKVDVFLPAGCSTAAGAVAGVFRGPVAIDLAISGSFPPPTPIPTTPTVTVSPVSADGAAVTVAAGIVLPAATGDRGSLDLLVDGVVVRTWKVAGTAPMTSIVGPLPVGTSTITARYRGAGAFASSTVSTTTTVEASAGRALTGSVQFDDLPPGTLGPAATMVGGEFDPTTGTIGPTTFQLPPITSSLIGLGFPIDALYQVTQLAPVTGTVAADGTVTFTPAEFRYDLLGGELAGELPVVPGLYAGSLLINCAASPIPVTLTGTADASGLHLSAIDAPVPLLPARGCSGLASWINNASDHRFSVDLTAAGDFTLDAPAARLTAVSLFAEVGLHNQTLLSATVPADDRGPAPTGTVTFTDEGTTLGAAAVDARGRAVLITAMDQAGPRTITATYAGDGTHPADTATATLDVTAPPDALSLGGRVDIGSTTLDVTGSTFLPQATPGTPARTGRAALRAAIETSGARIWFAPTTIDLDLPGHGPAQVEVRLNQYGSFDPVTINGDGTFDGLTGWYLVHVRRVTTATGTTTPAGCVSAILVHLGGRLGPRTARLTTTTGGAGATPLPSCTGAGRAAATQLSTGAVAFDTTIAY